MVSGHEAAAALNMGAIAGDKCVVACKGLALLQVTSSGVISVLSQITQLL